MAFKPWNWVAVPTPIKPDTFDYSVRFRNPDGSVGEVKAAGCTNHENAIREVAFSLRNEVKGPFLVSFKGGKE